MADIDVGLRGEWDMHLAPETGSADFHFAVAAEAGKMAKKLDSAGEA